MVENGSPACVSSGNFENGSFSSEKLHTDPEVKLNETDFLLVEKSDKRLLVMRDGASTDNVSLCPHCILGVDLHVASVVPKKEPIFLCKT